MNSFVYVLLEQRVNISYLREHSFRGLALLLDANTADIFAGEVAAFCRLAKSELHQFSHVRKMKLHEKRFCQIMLCSDIDTSESDIFV